jgi:hypothetical protein
VIEEQKLLWEKVKFSVAAIGGVILFFIGLWQFSITSRNEFAKPVLQKQLDLCVEASEAAATLAEDVSSEKDPKKNPKAVPYFALYFGKLGVVEDRCVYRTMVNFKQKVFDKAQINETPSRLALSIAFACRRLISKGWNSGLLGIYDPQRLLESFTDLDDYKETMQKIPECNG